jgi:hypothetical protein
VVRRALILLMAASATAGAQATADDVVRRYFQALEDFRWRDAAALLDLSGVERIRAEAIREATSPTPRRGEPTVESLMQRDSTMPREAAEYEVARLRRAFGRVRGIEDRFAGVSDADALAALPIEDAAARMLAASSPAYALRRTLERMGCERVPSDAVLRAVRPPARYRVLGTVVRDSVAYTLYEGRSEGFARGMGWFSDPQIVVLRLVGDQWKITAAEQIGRSVVESWFGEQCPDPAVIGRTPAGGSR